MDVQIANTIVEFIHEATGMFAIVCDEGGTIVAAKVASRLGTVHTGARQMLRENLPHIIITPEEEAASGGQVKAGINLPLRHEGQLIGSIGIAGDPEKTLLVTKMAAGLVTRDLREKALMNDLLGHAAQMDGAIAAIVATAGQANEAQGRMAVQVEEVARLIQASFEDIKTTDEVVATIQSIASNTQMLGLNAAIEAAHARQHGRGFAIVAEAVRKLSEQSGESAESIKATQAHLNDSMGQVVNLSRDLTDTTHEQTRATGAIADMVQDLKQVSAALMAMTRS